MIALKMPGVGSIESSGNSTVLGEVVAHAVGFYRCRRPAVAKVSELAFDELAGRRAGQAPGARRSFPWPA